MFTEERAIGKQNPFRCTAVDMAEVKNTLRKRIDDVERRIEAVCARAGRRRDEVQLIAVTKTVSASVAELLPEMGIVDLGESRPQELQRKAAQISTGVRWHQIGHLQRNKVDRTVPLVHLIHSVDSIRLLDAIEREAAKIDRRVDVLLEFNTGGEAQKHGLAPDDLADVAARLPSYRFARVCGLMAMAPYDPNPEHCRPAFAKLRSLRDELSPQTTGDHTMRHLSMGMTNDFEVAIEEGSTMVRLGSVLFEGLADVD